MQKCLKIKKTRQMNTNLLPIAKEGWKYIGCAIVVFLILGFLDLDFLQFFSFLAIIFFIYTFRNPEREIMNFQDYSVCSPVDGTVTSIQELKDEEYAYKVIIDSSYFNVSLLRAPLNSTVLSVDFQNGSRLSKFSTLNESLNENTEIVFTDKDNNTLKVVHRLKQSFKGLDIQILKAQKVTQSFRYGLMLNGVTTIYLPKNFRMNVSLGQELKASQSLVGYFTS